MLSCLAQMSSTSAIDLSRFTACGSCNARPGGTWPATHDRRPRRDEVLATRVSGLSFASRGRSSSSRRFGLRCSCGAAGRSTGRLRGFVRGPSSRAARCRANLHVSRRADGAHRRRHRLRIWLWRAGHRRLPLVLVAIVAIGRALGEAQKYWVARARPDLEPHLVVVKTSSFPSGHATSSMIFYLALALVLTAGTRWHRIAAAGAVLLSLLIGASRVMLGVHWPSDVIGGWAFGMLWIMLTLRLARRLIESDSLPRAKQL